MFALYQLELTGGEPVLGKVAGPVEIEGCMNRFGVIEKPGYSG